MIDPVPAGSDVFAGTFSCTSCEQVITTVSVHSLPACPRCGNGSWHILPGPRERSRPSPAT